MATTVINYDAYGGREGVNIRYSLLLITSDSLVTILVLAGGHTLFILLRETNTWTGCAKKVILCILDLDCHCQCIGQNFIFAPPPLLLFANFASVTFLFLTKNVKLVWTHSVRLNFTLEGERKGRSY